MYFKQIEITGFKSFADRTVIRLEPGITVIVGPNGSGKSNILDAMRWVLGEQRTRELRGSTMQDVIFNGSENRPPLGMAEVSVLFDNSDSMLPVDFAEVQVSRRLYRSGESEYLMNRAPCRLRDIQDVFMDTGIGVNAYSLIGQGKMDLILSQKPEDRRFIFEEAAGILKYKNRKRIAMKRLESAEQNLLRITDIVAEVERQMRSLKRQVHAAVRYRELNEQLRQLELRSAWLKYAGLKVSLSESRSRLEQAQNRFEEASAKITSLEAEHEEADLARLDTDRALLARREEVHAIVSDMGRIESRIALLKQQATFCVEQQIRAHDEEKALVERTERISRQQSVTQQAIEAILSELAECRAIVEARAEHHSRLSQAVLDAETRLEHIRARSVENAGAHARTQTELEALAVRIREIEDQNQTLRNRRVEEAARYDDVAARLERLRSADGEKQAILTSMEDRCRGIRTEEEAISGRLQDLHAQRQILRERKSSLEARLSSLRELRDTYEGYAAGVRAVMRAKAEGLAGMAGVVGPAGDLLSTESRFERAIEAALGGNINNVIVETADVAQTAIEFLKNHAAGRVTFLPLDIIQGGDRNNRAASVRAAGVIGPALDCVKYDPQIKTAVQYLLEGVTLVEDLETALAMARSGKHHPRLVTIEGEVVTSSGAVTGGRVKHEGRGLLGRGAEISQLDEQVRALDAECTALAEQEKELAQERARLLQELQRTAEDQNAISAELGELRMQLVRHSAELEALRDALAQMEAQRDDLMRQKEQLDAQSRGLLTRAHSCASEGEVFQREFTAAQETLARARNALAVCAGELGDLRVREAGLAHRLEELERERERQDTERKEVFEEIERRRRSLAEHEQRRKEAEESIQRELEAMSGLAAQKEEAQRKVQETENRRQQLLDETEALDKHLRELRDRLREAQTEVHQLELSLRSDEEKLNFAQERTLTEYGVALHALSAEEVGSDEYDESTRDRVIGELRQRLQRMGDVNLMAIEEYEALEKRHAFLAGQCEDLRQAREMLLGVIARSDKRIRELFMDTFEKVAGLFHEYFRRLFNGGQARLYLLNEDDPLESGIEIEARPPGKKPTSISQLSGGESALTAIALLYSILRAKPVPFCILDEVDAPLDDANIGRFLEILEEFAEQTQFLVITHNKQTMARADIMYGVTMQERGVSQIISARFEEPRRTESAA